ncbi:MAG: dipeptidase [Bacteroidales bacterium]|nr:membrane dipeptidase [Bacteroidota bacterium]MBL6950276.1 dipeptidase [Bacteroidales bacterium]
MKKIILVIFLILLNTIVFPGDRDSKKNKRKAKRIHERVLTIDSHNDTPLRMIRPGFDWGERHDAKKDRSRVDLVRMEEGGLDGSFFAVFVGQGPRTPEGYAKAKKRTMMIFDTLLSSINRYPDKVGLALTPEDAYKLEKEGKRIAFIGIENGYPVGKDLALIQTYYDKGARYITVVHTRNNDICDSSTDTIGYDGLSEFGTDVVKEMNRLGMMIDVSHASDASYYDILNVTKAPVIASHSCARALCDSPRNLDDDMLRALVANGGVIQMCILSSYIKIPAPNPPRDSARAAVRKKFHDFENLTDEEMTQARKEWYAIEDKFPRELATVSEVVDHIDHIVAVAGIDHIGIGTDFDGGGGVSGCYDASEMGNITLELVNRGYSEADIRKIWGENLMRVMRDNIRLAQQPPETN